MIFPGKTCKLSDLSFLSTRISQTIRNISKMFIVNYNNKLIDQRMCFFKNLEYDGNGSIEPCGKQCQLISYQPTIENQQFDWSSFLNVSYVPQVNWQSSLNQLGLNLSEIVGRIHQNNQVLFGFEQKLRQNEKLLNQADQQISENTLNQQFISFNHLSQVPHCELNQIPFLSSQPIINRIFGQKSYKYKLNLKYDFPKVIYKERNLTLTVRLCNPNDRPIYNANLIHLCVGVCNKQGRWIIQKDGDFFMKGKIQIDLYHGEAEFRKIYPRDVSRHFSDGQINIVIYPKTSLVNFTGQISKYERLIDCADIEPLVIRDITVKAKKKTHH